VAVTDVAEELNLAAAHEAIAAAVPDRDCVIFRDRRLTWAEVTDRTRRLAAVLAGTGAGSHGPLDRCAGHESPHDHVALYLHNGNEYLEGMLGAAKARWAAVNVNYRYVADELRYVLADSGARAIVVAGSFAPTLAEVLADLPDLRLVLQVDDGSGADLLPGALDYEQALAGATPTAPVGLSPDDLYVLYTGGTTGMPKGVLWRQCDFLAACLGIDSTTEDLVADAVRAGVGRRVLPAPPFMHGAAHWNAISAWLSGGTVVIQDDPAHLRADDIWATVARHRVSSLLIVGDAFARPLLDELRRAEHDTTSLRYLLTGGAVLSSSTKAELLDLLPDLRIVDVLGSSETGRQGVARSQVGGAPPPPGFAPSPTALVLSDDRSRALDPGDPEIGWLAQTGRVPRGYLGDPDKTARTFPVVDGQRCAVAGDRARVLPDGSIELHGRESVTINTGGEKVFAEEVEQALKAHPAVYDALVVGRPSERWGHEVAAVLAIRDGSEVADDELRATVAAHLARYKVPKAIVRVDAVQRSPSGKPDYRWALEVVSGPDGHGR
jgi:3-oxocholest-4-en-26-oate---CoA ligase